MSEPLPARLLQRVTDAAWSSDALVALCHEAAARIEELERELADVGDALDGQFTSDRPCVARAVQQQRAALDEARQFTTCDECGNRVPYEEPLRLCDTCAAKEAQRGLALERAARLTDDHGHCECRTCGHLDIRHRGDGCLYPGCRCEGWL